jgi:beta-phosphoglucomutase-like phosphatase (HAD superfamily)
MSDLEVAAAASAEPTPYVHEVVTGCRDTGRSVAIVSKNSARAVHAYLAQHGLDDRIPLVIARTSHGPALLKPDPYLINQAVAALGAQSGECALVGDSTTDVEAAQLASIHAIGYANKPGKTERLAQSRSRSRHHEPRRPRHQTPHAGKRTLGTDTARSSISEASTSDHPR